MLPYHTGVLDGAPTGPDMILMPGGLSARRSIEGDPVGTASEVDTDAAEELFRTTYPKLAGWVRRLVDDDDTAHEIAAEAFVRLLARWTRVESPQSYLYMIATNLIRDHWRKAERERRAMRSVTAGAALDELAYPVQDVDVRNLLASLPPRLRDRSCCLRRLPDPGSRGPAAPAGGHDQGRPVRGAGQAEDRARGTRCLTGATTLIPGWTGGSYDKKLAEGKTPKEALRSLKRQISNAIFACLQADAARAAARAEGPGGQQGNNSVASAAGSHPRHRLFGQATPGPGHHPTAAAGNTAPSPARARGGAGHSSIAATLPPAPPRVQVERPQRSEDERPGGAARRRPHSAARKATGQGSLRKPQRPKGTSQAAKNTGAAP